MQAFFLSAGASATEQRLALYHAPSGPLRGTVLALYPFAEEMNKARRMVGLGARALAAAGHAVLQIDLRGCGDSSGELTDTAWEDWIEDVRLGCDWLAERHEGPRWLWGTRAGCLVAAEAARRMSGTFDFLFWQPQANGRQVLQQFLRLKMASQLHEGTAKGLTESLQRELAAGRPVEVAGYGLGPALAQGLASATLLPAPAGGALRWLEVTSREPAALLPASTAVIDGWRDAGYDVQAQAVSGPPFWQTLEIEDAPALVAATVQAVQRDRLQGAG